MAAPEAISDFEPPVPPPAINRSLSPWISRIRPEANYFVERLVDYAAAAWASTASSFAARTRSARANSWKSPRRTTYDSGDFPRVLTQALEASDWKGFNKRKRESKKTRKLRGIGVGCYLEVTAPANKEMGGIALRRRRRRHHPHRHARLRPGPRHAVRPGAEREARRAVRQGSADPGRQRRADRRRRHRRLALDDEFGPGHRRSRGQGRSSRASRSPRMRSKPRRPTSSSRTATSSSPAPTAPSASWSWRRSSAPA